MEPLILSAARSREVDHHAITVLGLPGIVLMENAGRGAAEGILRGPWSGPVAVLCGPGNNGGDGYVVARHLHLAGRQVHLFHTRAAEALAGDARTNRDVADRLGLPGSAVRDADEVRAARPLLERCGLVVDALLGTGSGGDPRSPIADLIELVAELGRPAVALDLPSGLDADSGRPGTPTLRAERTFTFHALKSGLLAPGAAAFTGAVQVVSIGVPADLLGP